MARRKKPVDENGVPYDQPFAGYEVYEKINEENSITTWIARDLRLERDVMLKEIAPDLDLREDMVEEFFSEASSVARIRHKNIVRGLDTGRSGDKFYFVMEYHPSDTLKAVLESKGNLEEVRALEIAESIAKAFDCIYEEGISHGTVTPENILLGRDGVVRLSALGFPTIVLYRDHAARSLVTAEYCAPEMFDENSFSDTSSDLYSLGVILYQMLTGKLPFEGESKLEISKKHSDTDPVPPRVLNPDISDIASGVVMSLLAKEIPDRICEPCEFLEKLYTHPDFVEKAAKLEEISEESEADLENNDDLEADSGGEDVEDTHDGEENLLDDKLII